jgi:hypothetical protein
LPTTGKISCGTRAAPEDAAADPALRARTMRTRSPRAVVRWRVIELRFALEGRDSNTDFGLRRCFGAAG